MQPRYVFLLTLFATAIVVLAAYSNTYDSPFVFDDERNISQNANLDIESFTIDELSDAAFQSPTPRPIAYLSFALNTYFGGKSVFGFHVVNNFIHWCNGILVFWLVICILTSMQEVDSRWNHWIAFSAALLFISHPVQTQSVTYIVQRMTSLCTLFYLLGLICYFAGRNLDSRKKALSWAGILILWVLALGTKQFAVTLPFAILLVEWIVFQEGRREWFLKNLRLIVAILAVAATVAFVFKGFDFFKLFTRGYQKRDFTLPERLFTEGRVLWHYFSIIALPLPSRLTLVYDFPVSESILSPISTLISWLSILGIAIWALASAARHRIASFCVLWFLLHSIVESTFIPLELVYEHRLYLPLIGVCLAIPYYLFQWKGKTKLAFAILLGLVVLWTLGTWERNQDWKTLVSIWEDNVAKQPTEPRSHFNLAIAYAQNDQIDKSVASFTKALQLRPGYLEALSNRGQLFTNLNRINDAREDLDKAISLKPDEIFGKRNSREAYTNRGYLLLMVGEYEQAIADLNIALEIAPNHARSYYFRAASLAKLNAPIAAAEDFSKSIHLDANNFEALNNYAWMLATHSNPQIHNGPEAVKLATAANELTNWENYSTLSTLAAAHARNGEFTKAIRWQRECNALAPESLQKKYSERLRLYRTGQAFQVPGTTSQD